MAKTDEELFSEWERNLLGQIVGPEQKERIKRVTAASVAFMRVIVDECPPCNERLLALRALDKDVKQPAVSGIARNPLTTDTPVPLEKKSFHKPAGNYKKNIKSKPKATPAVFKNSKP